MTSVPEYFATYRRPHEPPLVIETLERCVRTALLGAGVFPLTGKSIYDAGCGAGGWLGRYLAWGAQPHRLTGVDLTPERIAHARATLPESVTLRVDDASASGLPDQSQDLVSAYVVFSTILDPAVRQRLANEMVRVKKPGGAIIWYDLRIDNPRNRHVCGIRASEVRALFAGRDVRLASVTLEPHIARFVAPRSPRAYRMLSHIPALHSHYLGIIR
jgi:ubiquinone/menaquinone biosynthesis C-methylase UbiE